MARKVFVTSDMSHDERLLDVAEVDPQAALLWPWFLTAFDDWGRAHAEPRRLKVQIFPGNPLIDHRVIARTLALLHDNALISVWESDGRAYMAVDNSTWFKWQTHIRKEKRDDDSGSKFPKPPDQVFSMNGDRSARFPAHLRAISRENEPSPSPTPSLSPTTAAAAESFAQFNTERARDEVRSQQDAGIVVKSMEGLARTIAQRSDFVAESERIWAHRSCEPCKGKGFTEMWSPGGGGKKVKCEEPV